MKIIGHRGARGLAAENTLAAIGHALKHRVDEIEFDVRVTRDGTPVLHHDAALLASGTKLVIADHDLTDLLLYKPDLARLDAALDLIDTKARPHIEIKSGEQVMPVVAVIEEFVASGMYSISDFLIGSKSQTTLLAFHRLMPEVETVVIESWSGTRAVLRARQLGTRRLSMRATWLWKGFLRPMHHRGWQIAAYTVNNPAKVRPWQPYLYGVITDYPDLYSR